MSNFKDFISSGGGGGADKLNLQSPTSGLKVIVGGSMTYTPSIDCTVVVTCIGAGGGGGSTYTVLISIIYVQAEVPVGCVKVSLTLLLGLHIL